ncbi:MAG: ABC transporter permease [Candidatus Symbiothrix sp.]|jgi:ABC-2 type transport system permease protein|nr:ABC transporter permease [Candidatus Symbiothrix sp.]
MKQLYAFVQKEFLHIFRDVRTILLIIGIPVAQILIIGFAVSTEVKNIKTAIYDPSNDVSTRQIIDKLAVSEYFNIVEYLSNPDQIEDRFQRGDIQFAMVFGDRFHENLYHNGNASVQLLADATDPNQGTVAANYAAAIISDYAQTMMSDLNIPFQIMTQVQMLYNPSMRSSYDFVPGLMGLIFILICAMMTSIAIVREKETGTMEVLLASPVKPIYIVLAKMAPYFLISWFILIVILLMSVFLLHVPITGNLLWLNVFSLIYIVLSLALGLLISTIVNTQVAAMLASGMGLMMPFMILSGMMFPIESMPTFLKIVSCIIPARWYISGVRKVMIEGAGVEHILPELLILTAMASFIILVSLKNFKKRLE